MCSGEGSGAVLNRFQVFGTLEVSGELWDTFNRKPPKVVEQCIEERPRSRRGVTSRETLENRG